MCEWDGVGVWGSGSGCVRARLRWCGAGGGGGDGDPLHRVAHAARDGKGPDVCGTGGGDCLLARHAVQNACVARRPHPPSPPLPHPQLERTLCFLSLPRLSGLPAAAGRDQGPAAGRRQGGAAAGGGAAGADAGRAGGGVCPVRGRVHRGVPAAGQEHHAHDAAPGKEVYGGDDAMMVKDNDDDAGGGDGRDEEGWLPWAINLASVGSGRQSGGLERGRFWDMGRVARRGRWHVHARCAGHG